MACGESRCTDRRRHKRRTGAGAGSAGDGRQSGRGSGAGLDTDRPGITTARQRLLLRLLMARVAEQYGKNEMALLLLEELDIATQGITLTQWGQSCCLR